MPRLFLLDGTALAYRAHFALAGSRLSTADGTPTGATYGFTMTLRRILEEEEPDLVAVALDAKGTTFRHERYADYKATRERAPTEMVAQLPFIRRVIAAHGVPLFEVEGVLAGAPPASAGRVHGGTLARAEALAAALVPLARKD